MPVAITSTMVRDLREKTGAGMMECKKALEKAEGDFDGAVKILRELGEIKGAKREGRTAAEGIAHIAINDAETAGSLIELNSETDFVARNEEFQSAAKGIAATGLKEKAKSAAELGDKHVASHGKKAAEIVAELVAKIGEKIQLNRADYVEADVVTGYIHPPGKIGVLIGVKTDVKDKAKLKESLKDIAMHIAAMGPRFLSEDEVDAKTLDAEREIGVNYARNKGMSEEKVPKVVERRVKTFYKENCLLSQEFVKDNKQTIKQVVDAAAKAAGGTATITRFVRFKVGETASKEAAE
ncbi:MAG TPA: translation elongation factor Ts [Candidatus Sumerlaeota bacterium]|nr:translation elongation factor Ts [Candidatus Sumerlaeota bacterium]HNM46136.1 translation elongation factor Ts [Candidatus Sumerlaeota bacterium]